MNSKLPYYKAYPMPMLQDESKMEKIDLEYLRSTYPEKVKKLLPHVVEECERMSYHGGMIYDEYPDRLQMELMCSRICDKVGKNEDRELLYVLMAHEIYKRRCDRRKSRTYFYF